MVRIGIIGGGLSGLGTAYYLRDLLQEGTEITIIEKNEQLGGLASGIKTKEWKWPVDKVIHHWFTTDKYALEIAKNIGMKDKIIIKNTKSSCFYQGRIAELDSATSLLKFPFLKFIDRIRMGIVMGWLRLDKNFLKYEKVTSFEFLRKTMGKKAFEIVWKPLFYGKFGKHAGKINAAWYWARVHPRTKSLAYIEGGFQNFSDKLGEYLKKAGCKIMLNSEISSLKKTSKGFEIKIEDKRLVFDKVVLAVPLQIALRLYNFPEDYCQNYEDLKSIGAQYFVLELEDKFLKDGTYWLNVNDSEFPFMMVAEHTNFINKKFYDNKNIIWVGKYLDYDHPLWNLKEEDYFREVIHHLKRINPEFKEENVKRKFFTKFRNAQPLITLNYSKSIPPIKTPVTNLFLANMNQIYPWDRGTNNALGLGKKVADLIRKD